MKKSVEVRSWLETLSNKEIKTIAVELLNRNGSNIKRSDLTMKQARQFIVEYECWYVD